MTRHKRQLGVKGFTLIELIIIMTIIGVLAAIALPFYKNYRARAMFTEVIQTTTAYKTPVELCARIHAIGSVDLSECNAGQNGIPAAINSPEGLVQSVTVSGAVSSVLITAQATVELEQHTYILKASKTLSGIIIWQANPTGNEGSCKDADLC